MQASDESKWITQDIKAKNKNIHLFNSLKQKQLLVKIFKKLC